MFYVYQWYNIDTNEIFYIGKGCGKRAGQRTQRNKLFKEYLATHNCKYKIIEYFDNEETAFQREHELILYYKKINQCKCNLDYGGTGGVNFVWTDEMRKNKSVNNPMKSQEQRKRMELNNPMKDKAVAQRVAKQNSKKVVIKNICFNSVKEASIYFNVFDTEICVWLKRGYDRDKQPCKYYGEEYKPFTLKVSSSKPVIIDDKHFDSVKQGAEYIGVWSESLIRAIEENRKCKGHTCKYGNQQPSHTKSSNK